MILVLFWYMNIYVLIGFFDLGFGGERAIMPGQFSSSLLRL